MRSPGATRKVTASSNTREPTLISTSVAVITKTYPSIACSCRPRKQRSDVESDGAQLLPAVVGDLLRAPRWHPDPIDFEVRHQPIEGTAGLVFDHVGEWAGRRGQRHVDGRHALIVEGEVVDEPEVDHVDAQLGVDHVIESFLDVINSRGHELLPSRVEAVAGEIPAAGSSLFSRACAVASFPVSYTH